MSIYFLLFSTVLIMRDRKKNVLTADNIFYNSFVWALGRVGLPIVEVCLVQGHLHCLWAVAKARPHVVSRTASHFKIIFEVPSQYYVYAKSHNLIDRPSRDNLASLL